jgi:hypothetical protein
MAQGGNQERRMVFDIRGKRRHVVKFVYAILALLMGASLFLVVGPVNIAGLFESGNSVSTATKQFEEQSARISHKLKKDPENADLLLSLTRAQVNTGNSLVTVNSETGGPEYPPEARLKLEEASESWAKYLKATNEPSPSGAQVIGQALYGLASTSRSGSEIETNIKAAAEAQQIVAKARPSLGSLSTFAIYSLYAFDYKTAEKAHKEAATYANTKFERENLGNELDSISKRAHEFQKELIKLEKEAKKAQAKGKPSIASPLSETNPLAQP